MFKSFWTFAKWKQEVEEHVGFFSVMGKSLILVLWSPVLVLCISSYHPLYSLSLLPPHHLSRSICGWLVESDGSKRRTRGPLCIFICPSVPSIHRSARCSLSLLSVHFLRVLSVCQHSSSSPPNTSTIHPLLSLSVPYCTASPPAPPLHPRWTEWTLCSKINFEMNEAMAVCACSLIFCQKIAVKVMSWSIYCQDTPLLWLAASRFMLWCLKRNNSPLCRKEISI